MAYGRVFTLTPTDKFERNVCECTMHKMKKKMMLFCVLAAKSSERMESGSNDWSKRERERDSIYRVRT